MVVSVYIGDTEVSGKDLGKIIITQNDDIKRLINHVVARVNTANKESISIYNIPKSK